MTTSPWSSTTSMASSSGKPSSTPIPMVVSVFRASFCFSFQSLLLCCVCAHDASLLHGDRGSSTGQQVISREGFYHCYILQFQSMADIHKDKDVGHLIQPAPHKVVPCSALPTLTQQMNIDMMIQMCICLKVSPDRRCISEIIFLQCFYVTYTNQKL
jgi:hypothetical protein